MTGVGIERGRKGYERHGAVRRKLRIGGKGREVVMRVWMGRGGQRHNELNACIG
jgi:hypothetical protein